MCGIEERAEDSGFLDNPFKDRLFFHLSSRREKSDGYTESYSQTFEQHLVNEQTSFTEA